MPIGLALIVWLLMSSWQWSRWDRAHWFGIDSLRVVPGRIQIWNLVYGVGHLLPPCLNNQSIPPPTSSFSLQFLTPFPTQLPFLLHPTPIPLVSFPPPSLSLINTANTLTHLSLSWEFIYLIIAAVAQRDDNHLNLKPSTYTPYTGCTIYLHTIYRVYPSTYTVYRVYHLPTHHIQGVPIYLHHIQGVPSTYTPYTGLTIYLHTIYSVYYLPTQYTPCTGCIIYLHHIQGVPSTYTHIEGVASTYTIYRVYHLPTHNMQGVPSTYTQYTGCVIYLHHIQGVPSTYTHIQGVASTYLHHIQGVPCTYTQYTGCAIYLHTYTGCSIYLHIYRVYHLPTPYPGCIIYLHTIYRV